MALFPRATPFRLTALAAMFALAAIVSISPAAERVRKPSADKSTADKSTARAKGAVAKKTKKPKYGEFNPANETVEMFAAIKKGDIEVKFIPKDSTEANVIITNKTKKPLNVRLPETFAAVPVLAQMGGMGGGGMGGGGMGGGGMGGGGGGGGQGMGGGMGGGGGGGMGGGGMGGGGMGGGGMGGGGMFNVAAEKPAKIHVDCVCLEHGKPEPRSAMRYEIRPLADFTDKPGVAELLSMLGHGQLNQRAAQVAAWHLRDGMTIEQLAAKRINRIGGVSYPYFSEQEIRTGMVIISRAQEMAEENAKSKPDRQNPAPSNIPSSETAAAN